jgi:hypothetical protein
MELLREQVQKETERMDRLMVGSGKGRPKSAEFEFAVRTILTTGKDRQTLLFSPLCLYLLCMNISVCIRLALQFCVCLVRLYLAELVYEKFEAQIPKERWFRSQRKGLCYKAFVYAMMRLARSDTVLQ